LELFSLNRVAWHVVSLKNKFSNENNGHRFAPKTYYSKIAYTNI